jgi:hypothetical protein
MNEFEIEIIEEPGVLRFTLKAPATHGNFLRAIAAITEETKSRDIWHVLCDVRAVSFPVGAFEKFEAGVELARTADRRMKNGCGGSGRGNRLRLRKRRSQPWRFRCGVQARGRRSSLVARYRDRIGQWSVAVRTARPIENTLGTASRSASELICGVSRWRQRFPDTCFTRVNVRNSGMGVTSRSVVPWAY